MPSNPPLAAAGTRDPAKRPRPLPKNVRTAVILMVRGSPDDPDGRALSFIEAAKLAGLQPDQMRRWLDRSEVRSFLRAERQAWRAAVCAGNESSLKRVRDTSENGMATVAAVRALEGLDEADRHDVARQRQPGFTILIGTAPLLIGSQQPTPPTIDVTPNAAERERPAAEEAAN